MITIDNVQYRNLEEQVKKNMDDIQYMLEEEGVLNEFGIKVVGQITSSNQLPDPTTYTGGYGDAYAVGTAAPYTLYIYTRANGTHPNDYWFNIGQFPTPSTVPGPQGPQGPKGPQGTRGSIWQNSTSVPTTSGYIANDKYLNTSSGDVYNYDGTRWQVIGNIRGPQGIQGPQGNVGPQGQQGIQGPKGDTGPAGPAFVIAGTVANEGQLPAPSTLADNIAYLVGNDTDGYDLYVQLQDTQTWQNVGKVEGVEGPQGPIGPQGPQGVQGLQGSTGPQGVSVQNVTFTLTGETPAPHVKKKVALLTFSIHSNSSAGEQAEYPAGGISFTLPVIYTGEDPKINIHTYSELVDFLLHTYESESGQPELYTSTYTTRFNSGAYYVGSRLVILKENNINNTIYHNSIVSYGETNTGGAFIMCCDEFNPDYVIYTTPLGEI